MPTFNLLLGVAAVIGAIGSKRWGVFAGAVAGFAVALLADEFLSAKGTVTLGEGI